MDSRPGSSKRMASNAPITSKRPMKKPKTEGVAIQDLKAKTEKRTKGKGKKGSLEGLLSMPMDVLFEIFGHLRPIDILHLSRTTKEFRRVLMHKSSVSVWKAARANVPDLPECFPGMNDIQFINLAFSPHCHVCLAPNIRSVDWPLRVRLCPKCTKTSLVEMSFSYWMDDDEANERICQTLVPRKETRRSREYVFGQELEDVQNHWRTLSDKESRAAYTKERRVFRDACIKHAQICARWFETQKLDRSQELEQARKDRKQAIIEKLTTLGWGSEIEKIPRRDDLSQHRLVKQPTQLTERIWKNIQPEVVKYMEQMKANRIEREFQDLIISRKSIAISVLRTFKTARLPWTEVMPEPFDFCNFAAVKEILEMPKDVTVDESSFDKIIPLLPSIFSDWRAESERHLKSVPPTKEKGANWRSNALLLAYMGHAGVVYDSCSDPEDETEDREGPHNLTLATTVFVCLDCSAPSPFDLMYDGYDSSDEEDILPWRSREDKHVPLFYPKVMGHRCLTRESHYNYGRTDPSQYLDDFCMRRTKWSCESIKTDKKLSKMMESIIEACDLDPLTATISDMDGLDAWLACPRCASWSDAATDDAQLPAFGWYSALKHQVQRHTRQSISWIKLSEPQRTVAQAVQTEDEPVIECEEDVLSNDFDDMETSSSDSDRWGCTHCLDLPSERKPGSKHRTEIHIKTRHDIDDPQLNVDYYKMFAATDRENGLKSSLISMPLKRPENKAGMGFMIHD